MHYVFPRDRILSGVLHTCLMVEPFVLHDTSLKTSAFLSLFFFLINFILSYMRVLIAPPTLLHQHLECHSLMKVSSKHVGQLGYLEGS